MKRTVRLNESDLNRIVRKAVNEAIYEQSPDDDQYGSFHGRTKAYPANGLTDMCQPTIEDIREFCGRLTRFGEKLRSVEPGAYRHYRDMEIDVTRGLKSILDYIESL